jgi:hypothetical protein
MSDKVALFDMDDTLCDYTGAMKRDLAKLAGPYEDVYEFGDAPQHIKERMWMIKKVPGWWLDLEPLRPGMALLHEARRIGYRVVIATKGPRYTQTAWTEKVLWCDKHLPGDVEVSIVEDKSLHYGRVLVDDWRGYAEEWLKVRPRGLVLMPRTPSSEGFSHPRVTRFDQHNLDEAVRELERRFED